MDEKKIFEFLTDGYAIAAVVTAILFYFTIRGQKRSANTIIHLARVCAACALVMAISLCARELVDKFGATFINPRYINIFQHVAIVLILIRESFLGIDRFCNHLARTSGDATSSRIVSRLLKASICLCAILFFGEYLGISFAGLLTFGGIGGIAIGLCECFVSAIGLSAWKDAVTFAILIIVLLVKPTGFLGRKVQEKV